MEAGKVIPVNYGDLSNSHVASHSIPQLRHTKLHILKKIISKVV